MFAENKLRTHAIKKDGGMKLAEALIERAEIQKKNLPRTIVHIRDRDMFAIHGYVH